MHDALTQVRPGTTAGNRYLGLTVPQYGEQGTGIGSVSALWCFGHGAEDKYLGRLSR